MVGTVLLTCSMHGGPSGDGTPRRACRRSAPKSCRESRGRRSSRRTPTPEKTNTHTHIRHQIVHHLSNSKVNAVKVVLKRLSTIRTARKRHDRAHVQRIRSQCGTARASQISRKLAAPVPKTSIFPARKARSTSLPRALSIGNGR